MKKWIFLVALVVAGALLGTFLTRRSSVERLSPREGPVVEAIYGLGKVKTDKVFEGKVGISARIERVHVHEGDRVEEGARLLTLSGPYIFKAPFAGTVTRVHFREGENIFPQAPIFRMEDFEDLYVEVILEQQAALRVRPQQSAKVLFESLRGTVYHGQVRSLFPRDDEFIAQVQVENFPKEVLPGMTADVSIEVGHKDRALLIPVGALQAGRVVIER